MVRLPAPSRPASAGPRLLVGRTLPCADPARPVRHRNARHDLHARGAVILFADERVLSSDEDEWERWVREAVEAEAYSRRLATRIREGYAGRHAIAEAVFERVDVLGANDFTFTLTATQRPTDRMRPSEPETNQSRLVDLVGARGIGTVASGH